MHNERADSAQQRLPKRWELLSAEQLCRMPVWDGFAKYLMEYISQSARSEDGFLAVGTQLDYFGAALNAAAARFKATGSDRVKIFFTCLDTKASTDEAQWLQKLRDKMVTSGFKRTHTLREGKHPESSGEKAQKQHVGGQENREGPSGRWAGSPHTPRLPLAPALAAPHWSTSHRSSRAGIVTCVARVGGPPHCTVAI